MNQSGRRRKRRRVECIREINIIGEERRKNGEGQREVEEKEEWRKTQRKR